MVLFHSSSQFSIVSVHNCVKCISHTYCVYTEYMCKCMYSMCEWHDKFPFFTAFWTSKRHTGVVLYIFHICVQFDVYVAKCFMLMYALCKNKNVKTFKSNFKEVFDFARCVWLYGFTFTFSRCFYPKRLTIAFRLYIFISMCVPWESNPQPFCCWRNALPLSHTGTRCLEFWKMEP